MKKFYLVGALGLSDATERRYGVVGPRRGRAASSATNYEQRKRNLERDKEREKENPRSCTAISGPGRSSRQLPHLFFVRPRAYERSREEERPENRRGGGCRRTSFARRGHHLCVLGIILAFAPSRHAPLLRCPVVPISKKRERKEKGDCDKQKERRKETERKREIEIKRERDRISQEEGEEVIEE